MNGKINFFVVEDHTLTNRGIRELLLEQDIFLCKGYAHSKDETLQKINTLSESQNLPDILILDLFLGSESGIDVLREIKRLYPSVKVVVYSMYTKPGIVSLAMENGANGFVVKSAPASKSPFCFNILKHSCQTGMTSCI